MDHLAFHLQLPEDAEQRAPSSSRRCFSTSQGWTTTLVRPVSSSSVTKTMPVAVPGRWRPVTMPAARIRARLPLVRRAAAERSGVGQVRAQQGQRVAAQA